MRDFSLPVYASVCRLLQEHGYQFVTMSAVVTGAAAAPPDDRVGAGRRQVLIRHDVDRRPAAALAMARLERELGAATSYYFRYPYTFEPALIREIAGLGHEVGYHYEVVSKTRGDLAAAYRLFEQELRQFREVVPVTSICMHGRPLSPYDNRSLWRQYDYRACGLVGEAYLSLPAGWAYFSDTGRCWDDRSNIRDRLANNAAAGLELQLSGTGDLCRLITAGRFPQLYLLFHPERWPAGYFGWSWSWLSDWLVNQGKTLLRFRPQEGEAR